MDYRRIYRGRYLLRAFGTYGAFLGPAEVTSFVSQDLSTTAGSLYNVSFWLASDQVDAANLTSSPNGFAIFKFFGMEISFSLCTSTHRSPIRSSIFPG